RTKLFTGVHTYALPTSRMPPKSCMRVGGQAVGNRRGSVVISTLEGHPNALEIVSITSQLPCITDLGLAELAGAWQNTSELAEAQIGRAEGRERRSCDRR